MKISVNMPVTPMDVVSGLPAMYQGMKSESLIDYAQPSRIEPVTIVESTLWRESYMEDLLQCALNIFSGYYIQAIALSAEIKGVSVIRRLEPFNPKRDPGYALADLISSTVALENDQSISAAKFGLPAIASPVMQKNDECSKINWGVATESFKDENSSVSFKNKVGDTRPSQTELTSKETLGSLKENSNLSVGKMLEVAIVVDDKTVKVPVNVRLHTIPVPSSSMTLFLTAGAQNRDLKERWYEMKADKLRFFADLIGIKDLLDEHRRNVIKDTTGLYLRQAEQKRKNALSGILSRKPSVAGASNIVFITREQQVEIEKKLNIKLNTLKGRRVIEQNSAIMILFVIDQDYDQVEIFHRGIEGATSLSINALKNAAKGSGPDVMKVFEMYKAMKAPTF